MAASGVHQQGSHPVEERACLQRRRHFPSVHSLLEAFLCGCPSQWLGQLAVVVPDQAEVLCHMVIAHGVVVLGCKSCCCCILEEALRDPLAADLASEVHSEVVHLVRHRSILVVEVLACLLLDRSLLLLGHHTARLLVDLHDPSLDLLFRAEHRSSWRIRRLAWVEQGCRTGPLAVDDQRGHGLVGSCSQSDLLHC